MDKKELTKFVTETYTKYARQALEKGKLYLAGKLTKEELDKELEVLADACSEELLNR